MSLLTISREDLYKEIWDISLSKVSRKYNIPSDKLKKICRDHNIPTPTSGYWTSKSLGKAVVAEPLPESDNVEIPLISQRMGNGVAGSESLEDSQFLTFLTKDERIKVIEAAKTLDIGDGNSRLHKQIIAHKSIVEKWNKEDTKAKFAKRGIESYSNKPPFLAGVVSSESLQRVYRLLDSVYTGIEGLGGSINDDLSLSIRGEHVKFDILEGQDEIKHEMTREEAQEWIKYEDSKRNKGYGWEPKIRKKDFVFNGKLRISFRPGVFIKDSTNLRLESRLGEILFGLYEQSEFVRINRLAREEAERLRAEERRKEELQTDRYNEEVNKAIELQNQASDYQMASRIRAYVDAVERKSDISELDGDIIEWIEWARKKADWYDPTISLKDEFFGKRKHGESEENKALRRKSHYW